MYLCLLLLLLRIAFIFGLRLRVVEKRILLLCSLCLVARSRHVHTRAAEVVAHLEHVCQQKDFQKRLVAKQLR